MECNIRTGPGQEDFSDLIRGIKEEYQRSNIQDIDVTEFIPLDMHNKIGWLLQNSENESNKDYRVNFDPLEARFMNKLVTEELLRERIVITRDDYFKGILFIDYLTTVILRDYEICKTFQDFERRLEQRNPFLDPDLQLIVKYSSVHFGNRIGEELVRNGRASHQYSKRKYDNRNVRVTNEYNSLRILNPIYQELGRKVCELIEEEPIREALKHVSSKYELKALVFTDSVVKFLGEDDKVQVFEHVGRKKYFEASISALEKLSEDITYREVINYLDSIETNYPNYRANQINPADPELARGIERAINQTE